MCTVEIVNTDIPDLRCTTDSVGSLLIPNGIVCYTGTTLGSTANYICDDGFEVPADNSQRVCQADGHWHGDIILGCLKSSKLIDYFKINGHLY